MSVWRAFPHLRILTEPIRQCRVSISFVIECARRLQICLLISNRVLYFDSALLEFFIHVISAQGAGLRIQIWICQIHFSLTPRHVRRVATLLRRDRRRRPAHMVRRLRHRHAFRVCMRLSLHLLRIYEEIRAKTASFAPLSTHHVQVK